MKNRNAEEKLEEVLLGFTESLTEGTGWSANSGTEDLASLPEEMKGEALSLFEAVRTVSSVIQKQPSEEFTARVSRAVQERYRERISTEKIQRIIGMAVTVEDFRKSLFSNVVAACRSIGLSLTPKEVAALRSLKEDAVKEFANSLDERITKFFPTNLP
jgi:hypothetical protein